MGISIGHLPLIDAWSPDQRKNPKPFELALLVVEGRYEDAEVPLYVIGRTRGGLIELSESRDPETGKLREPYGFFTDMILSYKPVARFL